MEFGDLTPKTATKLFEGEGGAYYEWSTSDMPLLAKANAAGGFLFVQPAGFALPHYADTNKLGYVLQGSDGVVGMVLPNTTKEVVLRLKKGDIIPVPLGAISWWLNPQHSQEPIKIVFLGETSHSLTPGLITYFFLTGGQGLLGAFSSNLISNIYTLTPQDTTTLAKSQTGLLIIKLQQKAQPIMIPNPQMGLNMGLVYNIDDDDDDDGSIRVLSEKEFPFMGEVGLSVVRVRLGGNEIRAPWHIAKAAFELIYVVSGEGRVEVVGMNGKSVLNSQVKVGHLILVPKFYGIALIAGDQGMSTFSILTTTMPAFWKLAGKGSIWEAISPAVQEVALDVDPQFLKLFLSNVNNTNDIIHPSN